MTLPADHAARERDEERVLLLVKGTRNGALTADLLNRAGIATHSCSSVADLAEKIGAGAAAALVTEEYLSGSAVATLSTALREQPVWSDFPFVVFSAGFDRQRHRGLVRGLGNVTFLDRPVHVRTMLASVQSAIRSRRRQYAGRGEIEARDTFLAMLGHELRNPLGAISLAVELLQHKTPAETRPRQYEIIARQSKHLVRLVDDLLDVARVTQGKLSLKRERIDAADVLRHAFDMLSPGAQERKLSYELDAAADLWISGDRERLVQVFCNLLNNSIKYTPVGGRIRASARAENGSARVRIEDSGVGLDPATLETVFEVFTQAKRSLDRSEGGLGLGLAVVRTLVDLHGGKVSASSDGLGRGACFEVELPLVMEEAAHHGEAPLTPRDHAPLKVVVVDDNADLRELLSEMLHQAGHAVTCAEDGPSGLSAILAEEPDIAFIDVGIPGFDGLELARRVRATGSLLRMVAVTGYGQAQDRRQALEAGFDQHLTKPINERDLTKAMSSGSTTPRAS